MQISKICSVTDPEKWALILSLFCFTKINQITKIYAILPKPKNIPQLNTQLVITRLVFRGMG